MAKEKKEEKLVEQGGTQFGNNRTGIYEGKEGEADKNKTPHEIKKEEEEKRKKI